MSDSSPLDSVGGTPVQERLQALAKLLRDARHLSPEVQEELADLLTELASELKTDTATPQAEHLAESVARVAHELHQQRDEGLLEAAKHRLEDAAAKAEVKAPTATGLARRLINLLADVGI